MRTMMVSALLACAVGAANAAGYLGTANQDVTVTNEQLLIGSTETLKVQAQAGTANIGTVSGSTVTAIIKDAAGNAATITGGKLDVNASISVTVNADVSASTVGIRGSQGLIITSESVDGGKTALDVLNKGRASLDGKSMVYKSSDNMVVGGSITLTGLANQVELQAISNDCVYDINGGEQITVLRNTVESFNFDYTKVNLVVNLISKGGGATCKVRIIGAN